jgi:hypothetical protein
VSESNLYSFKITNNNNFTLNFDYALNGVFKSNSKNVENLFGPIPPNSETVFITEEFQVDSLIFKFFSKSSSGTVSQSINTEVSYDCESCNRADDSGYNYIYGLYYYGNAPIENGFVTIRNDLGEIVSSGITSSSEINNFNVRIDFDFYSSYTAEITHADYETLYFIYCYFDNPCESAKINLPPAVPKIVPTSTETVYFTPTSTETPICINISRSYRDEADYLIQDPLSMEILKSSVNSLSQYCPSGSNVLSIGSSTENRYKKSTLEDGQIKEVYISEFLYPVCFACINIIPILPPGLELIDVDSSQCLLPNVTVNAITPTPEQQYNLSVNLVRSDCNNDQSSGVIGSACCDGTHEDGSVVLISATPSSGYRFIQWTGGASDIHSQSTSVLMDSNKSLEAVFEKIQSTLIVRFSAGGSAIGSGYHPTGSLATIEAVPYEGYHFVRWDGDSVLNSSLTTTIEMTCDMEVKAIFEPNSSTPTATGAPVVTPTATGAPVVTPTATGAPVVTPTATGAPVVTPTGTHTTEFSSLSCFVNYMSTPTATHIEQQLEVNCPKLIVSGSPYYIAKCYPPTPIPESGVGSSPLYWNGSYIGEKGAYDFDGLYTFHSYNPSTQEAIYYSSASPIHGVNVVKGKIIHHLINSADPSSGVCEMVGDVEFYRSDFVNSISFETSSTPLPIPVYSNCSNNVPETPFLTNPLSAWGHWES